MSKEKRRHIRTPFACRIKIVHDSIGELLVKPVTFLTAEYLSYWNRNRFPPIGTVVAGQVQGLMDDAPVLQMEVVRVEPVGVGLRFLQDD